MTSPDGPFYSTQDADSEGEEGKFFVWTAAEIEQILGNEQADVFDCGLRRDAGGQLGRAQHPAPLARPTTQDARMLQHRRGRAAATAATRQGASCSTCAASRVWPGRDEKVLTSWNGLMIAAFAQAAQVLDEPAYAAGRRAGRRLHPADDAHARRPAAAHLERRLDAEAERLPGGLRLLARRPGDAVRGDVRAALDRGGAGRWPT